MSRAKKDIPATDGHPERLIAGANYWSTYELSAGDCEKTEHSIEERKSECCERVEGAVGEIGAEGATVSPLVLSDGTYGLRKQVASFDCLGLSESVPATCFPPACLSACTFDPALLRLMGQALGEECLQESVDVLLGPAINIKRHPLGGRNFEYFSEDPLLSGKLASAYISGVQSTGVGACVKHFVGNSQETRRMTSDSVIDDRALHEIYLRGFEQVVCEGTPSTAQSEVLDSPGVFFENQPAAIMTAYNRLNGTYCSQNSWLLQWARNTWGYKGIFVSDWGAMSQSVPSVAAGLDLCMPGPRLDHSATVRKAVEHGHLPASSLEDCEVRLTHLMEHGQQVRAYYRNAGAKIAGQSRCATASETQSVQCTPDAKATAHVPSPDRASRGSAFTYDEVEHLALAQVIAEQGAVLLKNDVMPVASTAVPTSASVVAPVVVPSTTPSTPPVATPSTAPVVVSTPTSTSAVASTPLPKSAPALPLRDNQHLAVIGAFAKHPRYQGSGSARVNPIALDNTWDALTEVAAAHKFTLSYAAGYNPDTGETTPQLLDDALACAQGADTVLVFVGLPECYESEGVDRSSMALPEGMNTLVDIVCAAGKPVVVVLCGGSVMELPWREKVPSILLMYLAGCQGGHACANLLTGVVNPSGHLAESWPARVEDTALGVTYPSKTAQVVYTESVFVGYRYYTSAQVKPAYPFGYGLSYTTFALDGASVSIPMPDSPSAHYHITDIASSTREHPDLGIGTDSRNITANEFGPSAPTAHCHLTNTGTRAGAQVVQVYVHVPQATVPRPALALAGFAKVHLQPGETAQVQVPLDEHVFGYWDSRSAKWRLDAGVYEVYVGTSSEDLPLKETITLEPGQRLGALVAQDPTPLPQALRCALAPYFNIKPHGFTQAAFRALYGKPFPKLPPVRPFTPDSSVRDIEVTSLGRLIAYEIHKHGMAQSATHEPGMQRMMEAMLDSMPLRNLAMGGGSYSLVMAIVNLLNNHPVKAVKALFSQPEALVHELEEIPALEEGKLG